ncbi:MAG: TIGR03862 family flavoprotein, partial [Verrucomicrobiota bacterium]
KEMKAAPLVRRWLSRLRKQGITMHVNHRLTGVGRHMASNRPELTFNQEPPQSFEAVILALGGASWQKTGSDGSWTSLLEEHDIGIHPFQPANCGWEVAWPSEIIPKIEGQPLKNLAASAGPIQVHGELMPTRYGLEAGAIYQLGPILRAMPKPSIEIDFKPEVPLENLMRKMEGVRDNYLDQAGKRLKLGEATQLLLRYFAGPFDSIEILCEAVKALEIPLLAPRPIDEAISSAGGVRWSEIDDDLQLRKLPGTFVCGEMIDWEAPTGGFLIQACFATATHAARGALKHCGIS